MKPIEKARAAIAAAEREIEAANQAAKKAKEARQRHAEVLYATEMELKDLDKNIAASMETPEDAAAWREKRARLVAEIDGLRLQSAALADASNHAAGVVTNLVPALDAAKQKLFLALAEDLRPEMDQAVTVLARAWCLHSRAVNGWRSPNDVAAFFDFLFGPGRGLYQFHQLIDHATAEVKRETE